MVAQGKFGLAVATAGLAQATNQSGAVAPPPIKYRKGRLRPRFRERAVGEEPEDAVALMKERIEAVGSRQASLPPPEQVVAAGRDVLAWRRRQGYAPLRGGQSSDRRLALASEHVRLREGAVLGEVNVLAYAADPEEVGVRGNQGKVWQRFEWLYRGRQAAALVVATRSRQASLRPLAGAGPVASKTRESRSSALSGARHTHT